MSVTLYFSGQPVAQSTVTNLPAVASVSVGTLFYVVNGASGSPCLGVNNGSSWLRILVGTTVTAV